MMEGMIEKWIAVTVIVAVVCVIRSLARGKIRPGVIYGLWGLVVLRLLWPAAAALPESRYSIQNLQVSQKIAAEYEQAQEEWFQNERLSDVEQEPEQIFSANVQHSAEGNVSVGAQNVSPSVGQNATQNAGQNIEQNTEQNMGGQTTGSQTTGVQSSEIQNANRGESSQSGMMSQQPATDVLQQGPMTEPRSHTQVLPVWGWIWLAGSMIVMAGILLSQWRFCRQLKRERILWTTADQLCDLVEDPLPVYIWEGASSPFLHGIRPAIYVPKTFTEDEQTLDYILLHEWCHYRHGDHIWAVIRVICLVLYWHHPMVWVASALSRSDCEMACDDSVRIHLGEKQRLAYAGTLLNILETEARRERFGYMTTSMSGGGREAARRMTILWAKRPGKALTVLVACLALSGLGCTTFTTMTPAEGEKGSLMEADLPEESGQDETTKLSEGPGSSAKESIAAEPGMRLYEGIYYAAEIDKEAGTDVFCYLGTKNGNPRFEINGLTITNTVMKVGTPLCETVDGVTREVFYLMDLRTDDESREFVIAEEDENGVLHTFFYRYQYSWISMIGAIDGVPETIADEIDADAEWYELFTVDNTGEIRGWKHSALTDLYYMQCQWQLAESGYTLVEAVGADGWYLYGDQGPVDESKPYLCGDLTMYAQPDHDAEVILLQTEAERGSAQETQQTIRLVRTDDEHWIQIEAWNGTTGWVYMEVPGILRIQGELRAWYSFVEGPVATQEALISTVHQERTSEEEEAWVESILQKEPISIEIGEDGIQLMADVLYQADLDGDGVTEQFCYLGADSKTYGPRFVIQGKKYYVGEGYEPSITWPTAIYVKYRGDAGRRQETYYLCDIRKGDGQVEFGLSHWNGQRRKTSFLAYDGAGMDFIGTVDNIPVASADQYAFGVTSRELEQENIANGTWGFDGEGHIGLSMPMSLLQQNWYANVVWELDEVSNQLRLLPPEDGLYEISDPWYYAEASLSEEGFAEYPHLVQDLVIYQERDLQSPTQVLRVSEHGPDNKIYFTHTDNEHWIRIVDDAGAAGWFYMGDFDTIRTEEGEASTFEVFGELNMAG